MPEHRLVRGQIRDPVHQYVFTTTIERAILDDPLAQRLRAVGQSAAAQLLFPSMTVSRFAHSLGAMHIASRFFVTTLSNAGNAREDLLAAMVELVLEEDDVVLGRNDDEATAAELMLRRQGLHGDTEASSPRQRVASLVAEQALRLVSLLHDLGHLPFSHDFEETIGEWLRLTPGAEDAYPHLAQLAESGGKLHEAIGYTLADWAQDELKGSLRTRMPTELVDAARCSIRVAKRVLHSEQADRRLSGAPSDRLARWLYGLVSGEIDADRCDYVLRDSRNYGLIGAVYDLDRLIANLGVSRGEDDEWRTVVLAHGVSAAEEFLVARHRMYQWAIYHHKIQQCAAGLRRALRYALVHPSTETQAFLTDVEHLVTPRPAGESPAELAPYIARFADYTDAWWVERLKSHLRDASWGIDEPDVRTWAELYLYRARGPRSLWKKPTDLTTEQLRVLTRAAGLAASQDEAWKQAVAEIEQEHRVLVVPFLWSPWKASPRDNVDTPLTSRLSVLEPGGGLRPLSDVSPLVGALGVAWEHSLQVLAFAVDGEALKPSGQLAAVRDAVLARLADLVTAEETN